MFQIHSTSYRCFITLFGIFIVQVGLSQDHWETAINAGDEWAYLIPKSDLPSDWKSLDFDESSWLTGPGGFGYGDNDDGTKIEPSMSVYMRKKFNVTDYSKLITAVLHADYDDGFVAYLNGIEMGRSMNLGKPGESIAYNQSANNDHEAHLYRERSPEAYSLDSLQLASMLTAGNNILAIQVHNVNITSSDMSSNFFLSFGIQDESTFFQPTPKWFEPPLIFKESHLPIIVIDTYGKQIPDDPRITAHMGIINNPSAVNRLGDTFQDYDGEITIELRGNTSQWQDKKPYRFETVDDEGENDNISLLGMPEENDWVLYAPWSDKTLIRNVLTYQLSNEMGRYAARSRYCELVLNGDYKGVYVLMEKIKRDKNRIDISKLTPKDTTGDDLTGGYILKFDWYWTGENLGGFESTHDGNLYNYHYPKPSDIVPEQKDYIQQYISDFEKIMLDPDYTNNETGYPSILNVDSFADMVILQELSKNVDAYRLSTYIYKDKESIDNRLTAGPVWDINHGYGNCDYGQTWNPRKWLLEYNPEGGDQMSFWWEYLWADEKFRARVSERYTELRKSILSDNHIYSIIDSITTYLGPAIDRNYYRWSSLLGNYIWPNYYVFDTYEQEIEYLKTWISRRTKWMDGQILSLSESNQLPKNFFLHNSYPNPFNSSTTIEYDLPTRTYVSISICDILGTEVKSVINKIQDKGHWNLIWDGTDEFNRSVSAGVYLYHIQAGNFTSTKKMILLK